MPSRHLLIALSVAALAGCADPASVPGGGTSDDVALVTFDLQQTPVDAACVRLLVTQTGQGTKEKLFPVAAGGRSMVMISDLVSGSVTFSGQAFNVACGSITATTPAAYVADAVSTTITAGTPLSLTLTFRRPERAAVAIDFPTAPAKVPTTLDVSRTLCAGLTDGATRCRGYDAYGNAGDVGGLATGANSVLRLDIKRIANSVFHTCAVTTDESAYCWGDNLYGQIGVPSVYGAPPKAPTRVSGLSSVTDVAVNNTLACAIAAGSPYCWGKAAGSLGDGSTTSSYWPIYAPVQDAVSVTVGGDTIYVTTKAGSLYAWGGNDTSQVGDNGNGPVATPKAIAGLSNVTSVAGGFGFACAVASGQVYCWGRNDLGQCGNGAANYVIPYPTAVTGLTGITQIAAGNNHVCALAATGTVRCWGSNDVGQIGDNVSNAIRKTPAWLYYSGNAVEIAAGEFTGCARFADATIACWGSSYGYYPVVQTFAQ